MPLCLASFLVIRPEPTRRFLGAAVDDDAPTMESLLAAGVPRYDAAEFLRRLVQHGEVREGAWVAEARLGYRALLDGSASPLAGTPPARRLDRLPAQERPREKALRSGIETLADAELVAVLLRTGGEEGVLEVAQRLLDDHDGLVGLAGKDVAELCESRGLGPAKATELAAAFELGRRLRQAGRRLRTPLRTPEEVLAVIAADLVALPHEELWCLPLDRQSRLIGEPRQVTRGDVDGTDAGPRAFFRLALAAGATTCIAVHNHPSGDATPSAADRVVTTRLAAAGRAIDVVLVDHLIVGDSGRFTSLRREDPSLFR
jgi:DNA repair protein RadC